MGRPKKFEEFGLVKVERKPTNTKKKLDQFVLDHGFETQSEAIDVLIESVNAALSISATACNVAKYCEQMQNIFSRFKND